MIIVAVTGQELSLTEINFKYLKLYFFSLINLISKHLHLEKKIKIKCTQVQFILFLNTIAFNQQEKSKRENED